MSIPSALTFAAFQATGRDVDDLRTVSEDHEDRSYYPDPVLARVYGGGEEHPLLWIYPNNSSDPLIRAQGPWYIEIGNFSVTGELADVEAELYAFYCYEGAEGSMKDYLLDIAPPSTYRDPDPDSEQLLVDLLESFCAFHGLTWECASTLFNAATDPQQIAWLKRYRLRWDATVEGDQEAREQLAELDAAAGVAGA